jgi:hypothetical protein
MIMNEVVDTVAVRINIVSQNLRGVTKKNARMIWIEAERNSKIILPQIHFWL